MTEGIVGGKLSSGFPHGETAVALLSEIIQDPSQANGKTVKLDDGKFMFDYNQLIRFGIAMERIPSNSTVINRPFSLYQSYRGYFWIVTAALIILLAFVFILIGTNLRLKIVREGLIVAKQKAEDAALTKAQFMVNMGHEIRTPLGIVIGFSEMLRSPDLTPQQKAEYIEKIARNGAALSKLVSDILDASSIESGQFQVKKSRTSVSEILNDVLKNFQPQADSKKIELKVTALKLVPEHIFTDPVHLRHLLSNVIGNEIKFTDRGYVEITLSFHCNNLVIQFSDTGRGISDNDSTMLFSPFRQADSSMTRKFGGLGIGLALSRRLARALGGDLSYAPYPYGDAGLKGSTFTIILNDCLEK